jgi:hypothetical protein
MNLYKLGHVVDCATCGYNGCNIAVYKHGQRCHGHKGGKRKRK